MNSCYENNYYSYADYSKTNNKVSIWDRIRNHCFYYKVYEPELPKGSKVLDVGCGSGEWLYKTKKMYECEVYGCEMSEVGAQVGRENGISIYAGSLDNAPYQDEFLTLYDLIILLNICVTQMKVSPHS